MFGQFPSGSENSNSGMATNQENESKQLIRRPTALYVQMRRNTHRLLFGKQDKFKGCAVARSVRHVSGYDTPPLENSGLGALRGLMPTNCDVFVCKDADSPARFLAEPPWLQVVWKRGENIIKEVWGADQIYDSRRALVSSRTSKYNAESQSEFSVTVEKLVRFQVSD